MILDIRKLKSDKNKIAGKLITNKLLKQWENETWDQTWKDIIPDLAKLSKEKK